MTEVIPPQDLTGTRERVEGGWRHNLLLFVPDVTTEPPPPPPPPPGDEPMATNPPPPAAANRTMELRLGVDKGPAKHCASGFLNGFSSNGAEPVPALTAPLKIQFMRYGINMAQTQRFMAEGVPIKNQHILLYEPWYGNPTDPAANNWAAWDAHVTSTVNLFKNAGLHPTYDVWNEPDGPQFYPYQTPFTTLWKRTFDKIRQLDPQAWIAGPSFAVQSIDSALFQQFLQFIKANNCAPDVLSWHFPNWYIEEAANARGYISSMGLTNVKQIVISEYNYGQTETTVQAAQQIALLERAGFDGAMHAWWGTDWWDADLDQILVNQAPTGKYWVYERYARMTGRNVETIRSGDALELNRRTLDLHGALDSSKAEAYALVYNLGTGGNATVKVTGIPSYLLNAGTVRAQVEKIPPGGPQEALPATGVVSVLDAVYTVTGDTLNVTFAADTNTTYWLKLSRPGAVVEQPPPPPPPPPPPEEEPPPPSTSASYIVNVRDFGAKGDGTTDDTVAIQSAVNLCFGSPSAPNGSNLSWKNRPLVFPPGHYRITSPIQMRSVMGGQIYGAGRFTTIQSDTGSVFVTNGFQYSVVEQLNLYAGGTGVCFDLNWDNTGPALQSNSFRDVFFQGGDVGMRIGFGGFMGSENLIQNCFFANHAKYGLFICNFNALQQTVTGGNFQNCGVAIYVERGAVPVVNGVGFQQSRDIDIRVLNGANDSMLLQGCRTESPNFVDINHQACTLLNCVQVINTAGSFAVLRNPGALIGCISQNGKLDMQVGGTVDTSQFGRDDWLEARPTPVYTRTLRTGKTWVGVGSGTAKNYGIGTWVNGVYTGT
jgi:hypothetical protein